MRGLYSAKNLISRVNKKALVSINMYVHMNMHMNELHRCIYEYGKAKLNNQLLMHV